MSFCSMCDYYSAPVEPPKPKGKVMVSYLGLKNCCVIYCQTDPARWSNIRCPTCQTEMVFKDDAWRPVNRQATT